MDRKRMVELGDEGPAAAAAGTSGGGGSDSARKRQANGGGGGENGGGNAQAAAAANGKPPLLREFDEAATISPYTGRDYSKKYFDILEKRKGGWKATREGREGKRVGERASSN